MWHAARVNDMTGATNGVRYVVGAAIVDDVDAPTRLLAARRTEPPRLAGGWELPGGKVEPGEEPVAALHRELAEELGVRVALGRRIPGPLADGGWPLSAQQHLLVWWASVTEGDPAPLEDHDVLRWLDSGEWLDVAWLPADVPVVRRLVSLVDSER